MSTIYFCHTGMTSTKTNLNHVGFEESCTAPRRWKKRALPTRELDREAWSEEETPEPMLVLEHDVRVRSAGFSPDGTLIVTTGDPLEITTDTVMAFIDGRQIDLGSRHKTLYAKYQEKYRQLGTLPDSEGRMTGGSGAGTVAPAGGQ